MYRVSLSIALVLILGATRLSAQSPTTDDQFDQLVAEYESEGGARLFAGRFLELAQSEPDSEVAVKAALWIVENVRGRAATAEALQLLNAHHAESDVLVDQMASFVDARSVEAENLLTRLLDVNENQTACAQACYYLTQLLSKEAELVAQMAEHPERAPQVIQYYGAVYGEHLAGLESDAINEKLENLYGRLKESFADQTVENTNLGSYGSRQLFKMRHLSVGKEAPEIFGEDIDGDTFRLTDYRGKVVMLSFWGHW